MTNQELFSSVGGIKLTAEENQETWYFGWVPTQTFLDAYQRNRQARFFAESGKDLKGTGAGKIALLYEAVRRVWKRDLDIGPQLGSDCVGWSFAGCVDLIACLEVVTDEPEQHSWELRTSTEAVYGMSRVEYGDYRGSRRAGSFGAWAAEAVERGGTISRRLLAERFPSEGGDYNLLRTLSWGINGLPDELEPIAREHRIGQTSLVRSFEEARDAIANGYPVAVGSSQGFTTQRDAEGFALPQGTWYHSMKFIGSRDDHRPGLLCMNSFGAKAHKGLKGKFDIPEGSFWVDAEICTKMFQHLDSYALSQFDGYPLQIERFDSTIVFS
jgi:hypothetical protein